MTPEEISFLENFVYPGILLGIGAGITILLIPYINRIHEEKLKNVDREREDHRFELEIKDKLFKKLSAQNTWAFVKYKKIQDYEDKEQTKKIISQSYNEINEEFNLISDMLLLYFGNNPKLKDAMHVLKNMTDSGVLLMNTDLGSKLRKERIEEFNKEFNNKMSKEEIEESVNSVTLFKPIFNISFQNGMLRNMILKAKIDLPY